MSAISEASSALLKADYVLATLALAAVAAVGYQLLLAFHNAYLHPLRHIPGPKLSAATRLVWAKHIREGTMVKYISELHEKYGDVVRLAPTEISFISGETAWQEIYGHRTVKKTGNKQPYLKDPMFYPVPPNGVNSIIAATEADHSRQRRLVSHAFSDKALREQEHIIQTYVNLLVKRMYGQIEAGNKIDMVRWYNFTTFDVIAALTFGESFHCLRDNDYHPWVSMAFQVMKSFGVISLKRYYPTWAKVSALFKSNSALKFRSEFFAFVDKKIADRMAVQSDLPDFMSYIMKAQSANGMTIKEIESSLNSFMVAGSETSATTLSGITYFLCTNPDKFQKLAQEIRSKFQSQEEITINEVMRLPYLIACLNETLRMYPPVPTGFPRVVPPGGDVISGNWVPEKTSVYVSQFAANHSARNFTDPDTYVPERWLKNDERYAEDKFNVFNPFSYGPRDCLGKNLAAAEMRLVIAKMVWNFDFELHPDTEQEWTNQKVFVLWEKPSLFVNLKPVVRA